MEESRIVHNIITLKVGNKYGAEYVNILHKYCRIFCSKNFNFVCFTENEKGLDERIIVREIPHATWKEDDIAGWWLKLSIFQESILEENSINLFLDLDNIICNQIDKFFDICDEEHVYSIKDWIWYDKIEDFKIFNTSAITWHGKNKKIRNLWKSFMKNKDKIYENFKLEQDYFSYFLKDKLISYPDEWVVSFKECFQEEKEQFTDKTSIIVFHGFPKPHDIIMNKDLLSRYPWVKNLWNPM